MCVAILIALCLACVLPWAVAYAEEEQVEQPEPQITLGYIYVSCNDIAAMRHFYVELIGLQEQSYRDDGEYKWLCCNCRGFELMFFAAYEPMPVPDGWHAQPGWEGGKLEGVSWSIEVPAAQYAGMVQRLIDDGVPHFFETPQWFQDSYWGFPVKDPMGNTAEIFMLPKERPASTTWPGTE